MWTNIKKIGQVIVFTCLICALIFVGPIIIGAFMLLAMGVVSIAIISFVAWIVTQFVFEDEETDP